MNVKLYHVWIIYDIYYVYGLLSRIPPCFFLLMA